jgi:hypothetical protein
MRAFAVSPANGARPYDAHSTANNVGIHALPESTLLLVASLLVVILAATIAILVSVIARALASASTSGPLAILSVSDVTEVSFMLRALKMSKGV